MSDMWIQKKKATSGRGRSLTGRGPPAVLPPRNSSEKRVPKWLAKDVYFDSDGGATGLLRGVNIPWAQNRGQGDARFPRAARANRRSPSAHRAFQPRDWGVPVAKGNSKTEAIRFENLGAQTLIPRSRLQDQRQGRGDGTTTGHSGWPRHFVVEGAEVGGAAGMNPDGT